MGDFGLGFLYGREDRLPKLESNQWSFRQSRNFEYHAFPGDKPGPFPASYERRDDAAGLIDVGLSGGRMRVSPSIYNTRADVDALLIALSQQTRLAPNTSADRTHSANRGK